MELYGPIFKLKLGEDRIFIGSQELVNEVCDQDKFAKVPGGVLEEVRALTGDGLFTAFKGEMNWWKAHRLLVPVRLTRQYIPRSIVCGRASPINSYTDQLPGLRSTRYSEDVRW